MFATISAMGRQEIHPDQYYGEEAASEKAGEEVWFEFIRKLRKDGRLRLAQKVYDEQFRKDDCGNVFVMLKKHKIVCGHISEGYDILRELINRPSEI